MIHRGTRFRGRFAQGAPLVGSALLAALVFMGAACKHGGSNASSLSGTVPAPPAPPGDQPGFPFEDHVDQSRITAGSVSFRELFTQGDILFETRFNDLDGGGALVLPDGTALSTRFSRTPPGGGRFTGPNANACDACHNSPLPTSGGGTESNVSQDPSGLGIAGGGPFNLRNTTSLFGSGALQRLAEEMTEDLLEIRAEAEAAAAPGGAPVVRELSSKGISFGTITVVRDGAGQLTEAVGGLIDDDLVVRPYGWKGNVTTLRVFCRSASLNELGMEPEELVARDPLGRPDPDGDGVEGELSVGDITAITVYVASQEIPQTLERLIRDNLAPPTTARSGRLIGRGRTLFSDLGCAGCHVPELRLIDPVFEEPTLRGGGNYFDPNVAGLDAARPFRFNLIQEGDFPRLEPHPQGGARVPLFGDLRRHRMGRLLADPQETPVDAGDGTRRVTQGVEARVPRNVFLTAELWGVGNSGPWLHDGRAGTLEEAILLHGEDSPPAAGDPDRSEAQEARDAFKALSDEDRLAVVEFLRNLVLFALPEDEEEE